MRHGKIRRMGLVLLPLLLLSGCGLMPTEKQYTRVPIVREYVAPEYQQAYVQRGELALTENISCRYMAVHESILSFGVNGVYYDAVYVQQGDQVKQGDLLATLEMGDVPQRLADAENRLRELELARAQLYEQQALAIRHQQALLGSLRPEKRSQEETVDEVAQRYADQLEQNTDAIYLQELQLQALTERRAQREIRADMDGTVTYVRRIQQGERSVENSSFLRIADMTHSVFMGSTERWNSFQPGDRVTVTSKRVEYEAVITAPEDLNLSATKDPTAKKRNVYFSLSAPAPELEDGDQGTILLTLDSRADTLYLEKKAIHTVEDQRMVYYKDPETGIRGMKYIETGLETPRFVEIIAGLTAGEAVILK